MVITILEKQDAQQYWNLRLEALKRHPEAFATSYEEAVNRTNPIQQVEKNLTSEGSITFGAFEDEDLVGICTLVFTFSSKAKMRHKAEIVGMYVKGDYQQRGVGKQLMTKAVHTARQLGYVEQLLLQVTSTNESAKTLYKSIGFKKYGTEPKALKIDGVYFDEDLMVLYL